MSPSTLGPPSEPFVEGQAPIGQISRVAPGSADVPLTGRTQVMEEGGGAQRAPLRSSRPGETNSTAFVAPDVRGEGAAEARSGRT